MKRSAVPEGIRITKVGLVFILITVIVGVAAANTGNNSLYLVVAFLLATLVVSGITSRRNLRLLDVELDLPEEVYAKQPFTAAYQIRNRDRWMRRRWVILRLTDDGDEVLVQGLDPRAETRGRLDLMVPHRGPFEIEYAHVRSLFPMGLFQKGMRFRLDHQMLIFPEIFSEARATPSQVSQAGEERARRRGSGHDLHTLRRFRAGDDWRSIHWKQTARVGHLVFVEREAEGTKRMSIALDNAVGELTTAAERQRFEVLVSEAATAAYHALERGYDVELLTRDGRLAYGRGRRHRLRLMRHLAQLEATAKTDVPLVDDRGGADRLQLGMERGTQATA